MNATVICNTLFALYDDVNFHLPGLKGLLPTSIEPKVRRQISGRRNYVDTLLKYRIENICLFFKALLSYIFSGPYIKWR